MPRRRLDRLEAVARDVDLVAAELEQDRQAVGGILVVVDDQDAASRRRHGGTAVMRAPALRQAEVRRHRRKPHHELAAEPEARTRDLDGAAVHLDQALHERQADAEPPARALE
jgi:hypothetical protein